MIDMMTENIVEGLLMDCDWKNNIEHRLKMKGNGNKNEMKFSFA